MADDALSTSSSKTLIVDAETFDWLLKLCDNPPPANAALKKLMSQPSPYREP